jgi:hypothetical protein
MAKEKTSFNAMKQQVDSLNSRLDSEDRESGVRAKVKCGACQFLTGHCPAKEAPCVQLGKTASSWGCKHFEPDYGKMKDVDPAVINQIGKLTRDWSERNIDLLIVALNRDKQMRKATEIVLGEKVCMGQRIMVNMSAPRADYLNCWFVALAQGVTRNKRSILVHSDLHNDKKWCTATLQLDPENIMTMTQFAAHRKFLVKKKLINAPESSLSGIMPFIPNDRIEEYVHPTIAKAPPKRLASMDKKFDPKFKVETKSDGRRVITL